MKVRNLFLAGSLLCTGCPPSPDTSNARLDALGISMVGSSAVAALQSGVAVSIIFDTSGSMEGERLQIAKQTFNQTISPRLMASKIPVEHSIISCGGSASVIQPNALLEGQALDVVNTFNAGGGTPLGESILEAYNQLASSHREQKFIFILSDGEATGVDPRIIIQGMKARGVEVGIFVVGFQTSRENYAPISELGGSVMMADDAKALESVCDAIFKQILRVEAE